MKAILIAVFFALMINSLFASSAFFRNQEAAAPKFLKDCPAGTTVCGEELCCPAGQRCHWHYDSGNIVHTCA